MKKVAAPVKKTELTAGGIRCADHATPFIRKSYYLEEGAASCPVAGDQNVQRAAATAPKMAAYDQLIEWNDG
jgi:hypothetical protein